MKHHQIPFNLTTSSYRNSSILILIAFFFLTTFSASANQNGPYVSDNECSTGGGVESATTIFNVFQGETIVPIRLKTDLGKLMKEKKKPAYQDAELSITNENGEQVTKTIKVKPRGKSRRQICDFPPIKMKFSKDDLEQNGLERSFNKLKLVTHCFSSGAAEQNLIKEFLAYKMYNLLTDKSFQVQLVKIEYEDTEDKIESITKYGFIIESDDELAERLNSKSIKRYNIPMEEMDNTDYHIMNMFQYMIGNTDWQIEMMHNVKVIQKVATDVPIIVPYDFDFSGLVNAKYARPNPDYKELFNVRDRLYLAKTCPTEEVMESVVELFKSKKAEMLALCESFKLLNKKECKSSVRFIKSFYKTIESPKAVKKAFFKSCK